MTRFRLVATDIDGTLLDPNGAITPRTLTAVQALRDADVILTLATSRRLTGTVPVAQEIGLDCYLILYDGAQIRSYPDLTILHEERLALDVARRSAALMTACGLRPIAQYADAASEDLRIAAEEQGVDGAGYERDYLQRFFRQTTVVPFEELCPEDKGGPLRVVAFGALERLERAATRIAELHSGLQLLSLGNYGASELTVFSPNTSKGAALTTLASRLGVAREQVFAIGDGINDVSLLSSAGLGVAMANGEDATRKVAHTVTASNVEDGMAQALERYVLRARV